METIHPTQEQSIPSFWGRLDDPLAATRRDRVRAHPVVAPIAWLVCGVLGGLFWLALGYCIAAFF